MKTAKEMFEELGYEQINNNENVVWYQKREYEAYFNEWLIYNLFFDMHEQHLFILNNAKNFGLTESVEFPSHEKSVLLKKELFKAIHQQMKELGWLDE